MSKIDNKDYHAGYVQGHFDGHQTGATEWAGKAQVLMDALESMKNINASTMGAVRMKEIAANAVAKYKEVSNV